MRTRRRRWCDPSFFTLLFVACWSIGIGATGEYRTTEVELLKITFDAEWGSRLAPGYVPVRVDITNLGEARVIEIFGYGNRFFRAPRGMESGESLIRQAVRLARGDRVRLTIPVPIAADHENIRFEIREDGRTIERFNYSGFQGKAVIDLTSALVVADPVGGFGTMAQKWLRSVPTGTAVSGTVISGSAIGSVTMPGRTAPPLDFMLHPTRLPTNWLGYTSLRAVITGPTEWAQLDDSQKSALLTWTASGGELLFVDADAKALLPADGHAGAAAADPAVRPYFFGCFRFPTSAELAASGLSGWFFTNQNPSSVLPLPVNRSPNWGRIESRGFRLAIPGVAGVPARAYLVILMVFTFLIGPASYWFLWRKRRQVLIVLTAPAISALFIVLLAGYVLAGEGVGVRARAVTVTMLDQVRKQASTRASVSLYAAGMTPSGGMRFNRDVAVFPIGGNDYALDLSEAQRFSSGVIQARAPTNLEIIGFRPARERLTFTGETDGIEVVNGLGTTVTTLLYKIGGRFYGLATPLPSGGKAVLKPGWLEGRSLVPADAPESFRLRHLFEFERQPPGSYLAVLERSPFWDPGVSGVGERGSFHLLIGWPEGQP